MRCGRHAERTGAIRNEHKILVKSLKRRDHSEELGIDGRIITDLRITV
jgi:hypothetical protein